MVAFFVFGGVLLLIWWLLGDWIDGNAGQGQPPAEHDDWFV